MSWQRVFELWKELTGEDLLAKDSSDLKSHGKEVRKNP
jgi:hypothetical protein